MKTNLPAVLPGVFAALVMAMLMLVLGGGTKTSAQVVTNASDSGPGTLRDAIANATNDGTITFCTNLSGAIITLSNTLTINTNLTIDASALPGGIQINGNSSIGIFNVASGTTAVLNSLTITNGYASNGGGIDNFGTLTLNNCTLSGNSTPDSGPNLGGGGIYNDGGTLTVNNCTLSGNSTVRSGGGIYNNLDGTLTVNQCTLAENTAGIQYPPGIVPPGGGIANFGTLTVNQCTLSENTDYGGGGGIGNFGTLTIINSIVAGNGACSNADIYGPFTCCGANIVQNYCGTITGSTPINAAPLLAPLANYGGPTQTMPPLPGSPAIDGCTSGTSFTTDQRGFPRVVGPFADIGAVEFSASPVVTNTADSGPGTLRDAINYATNEAIITFCTNLSGAIILVDSTLGTGTNLTIDASALPDGIQLNANITVTGFPIFDVASDTTVVMNSLTIANGIYTFGGGIINNGTLTLNQCTVSGNGARFSAGGINNYGTMTLNQCTLSGNFSEGG